MPPEDEPLVLLPPQSLAVHCGSLDLRPAHFEDLLFCPECEAAGVFVAFSCDAPLALMWLCALSRPVDLLLEDFEPFDVDDFDELELGVLDEVVPPWASESLLLPFDELLIEPLFEEPLVPSEPEVEPLLPDVEPVPLIDEPLPDVEDAPLPYVLPDVPAVLLLSVCVVVALVLLLSFLCLRSPIARAEPLARAMMEVSTNAGASLRILPPIGLWFRGITCGRLLARPMPPLDARVRG